MQEMGQNLKTIVSSFLFFVYQLKICPQVQWLRVTDDIENLTKTIIQGRQCPLDTGMKFYFISCSTSCLNFTFCSSVAGFA